MPGLPRKRGFEHEINLQDEKPVHRMPYHLSPVERETMRKQINEMLDLGLIRPSKSPYGATILFVKKTDGTFFFGHRLSCA